MEVITCEEPPGRPAAPELRPNLVRCHHVPAGCRTRQWLATGNGFYRLVRALHDPLEPSVLHDTGLWLPNNHACAMAARQLRLPYVSSPRGMLAPWSLQYRGFKKRLAWALYQHRDLGTARLLHATSAQEAGELHALGLRQPIAVIPNGVALPQTIPGPSSTAQFPGDGERTALFLSRLHPKKGLLDLVQAWAVVQPIGWRMLIGGGDERGHRAEVEAAVRERGLTGQFQFIGEVAERAKWSLYRDADLFILPSHSENFGLVVAEALASGVPVITTRGTPWREVEEHRCGWWTESGVEPLARALRAAIAVTDLERHEMGQRGRLLIESRYAWARAAEAMKAAYEWLLGLAPKPSSIV